MNAEASRILAIAWKDVTAERRSKANFAAVVFFSATMLIIFGMTLGPDNLHAADVASGVLWITVLLSGVLSFNRSYERELEAGALDALLLYPGDRRSIFIGKLIANLLFVMLIEVIAVPVAVILFSLPIAPIVAPLIGILFLGTLGFVTLGTFYAAMSSRSRGREVLLPLLLFPMLIPLMLAAVKATQGLIGNSLMGEASGWGRVLVVFDIIFLAAAYAAFEHVIEA